MTTVTNQLNTGATPIAVSQGGIGVNTLTTAYSPVCAGTTATGAFQPASTGLSTSGYILCSNGSSAVPSFQQQPVTLSATATITSANINNMYATPVQVLAAQGAHTLIVVYNVIFEYVFNTLSATLGGTVVLQYGNTAHGAGTGIFIFEPDILVTSSQVGYGGAVYSLNGTPQFTGYGVAGNLTNTGLFVSNTSAAFVGGNSSAKITIFYMLLSTTV